MRGDLLWWAAALYAGVLASACEPTRRPAPDAEDTSEGTAAGGAADSLPEEESLVELFSWWTGPGEAEALLALIEMHEREFPGHKILNATSNSGIDVQALLDERFAAENPPDLFQQNVFDVARYVEAMPGAIEPLDELFWQQGWDTVVLPEVLEAITIDGTIYSMPVGIHRENSLLLNSDVFKSLDLTPPESVEEFLSTCDALGAAGVEPLALGYQGWVLRIAFHAIAIGTMGGDRYQLFFSGNGDREDSLLDDAIVQFESVLSRCVPERMKSRTFEWQDAAQALYEGKAAMMLHGDWAGGYLKKLGWEAGADYSVVGAPGAQDVFLFGVDVLVVPAEARNREGALKFLQTVGSLEAQIAFSIEKGSTPVRIDADNPKLSVEGSESLRDLRNAHIIISNESLSKIDSAVLAFAEGLDREEFALAVRDSHYP